jgi:hypothetical protein
MKILDSVRLRHLDSLIGGRQKRLQPAVPELHSVSSGDEVKICEVQLGVYLASCLSRLRVVCVGIYMFMADIGRLFTE